MNRDFRTIEFEDRVGILEKSPLFGNKSEVLVHALLGHRMESRCRLKTGHVQASRQLHDFDADLSTTVGHCWDLPCEVPNRNNLVFVDEENKVEERKQVQLLKRN